MGRPIWEGSPEHASFLACGNLRRLLKLQVEGVKFGDDRRQEKASWSCR